MAQTFQPIDEKPISDSRLLGGRAAYLCCVSRGFFQALRAAAAADAAHDAYFGWANTAGAGLTGAAKFEAAKNTGANGVAPLGPLAAAVVLEFAKKVVLQQMEAEALAAAAARATIAWRVAAGATGVGVGLLAVQVLWPRQAGMEIEPKIGPQLIPYEDLIAEELDAEVVFPNPAYVWYPAVEAARLLGSPMQGFYSSRDIDQWQQQALATNPDRNPGVPDKCERCVRNQLLAQNKPRAWLQGAHVRKRF